MFFCLFVKPMVVSFLYKSTNFHLVGVKITFKKSFFHSGSLSLRLASTCLKMVATANLVR